LKGAGLAALFASPVTFKPLLIRSALIRSAEASALPPEKGNEDGTKSPVRSPGGQGEAERTKGAVKAGPAAGAGSGVTRFA
jgi:hypothetical protein